MALEDKAAWRCPDCSGIKKGQADMEKNVESIWGAVDDIRRTISRAGWAIVVIVATAVAGALAYHIVVYPATVAAKSMAGVP
jgi:hypothetical protein